MASYNKVLLMGNLTRDPQLRFTASQVPVCEFSIAVNNNFTTKSGEKREEVTFVDITAWSKQAELINQYFQKGKPIFVEGRLKQDVWDDKATGAKRSKLLVTLEGFQFVGGRDGGGGGPRDELDQSGTTDAEDDQTKSQRAGRRRHEEAVNAAARQPFGDDAFKGDDIPF